MASNWYKNENTDKIWWLDNGDDTTGEWIFSFDKKKTYNMFADYPYALTAEEKEIFDRENPYWAGFFIDRCLPDGVPVKVVKQKK